MSRSCIDAAGKLGLLSFLFEYPIKQYIVFILCILFSADLPDALRTDCEKCNEKQKQIVRKAARYLMNERPQHWDSIVKKFDPERQYADSFNKFLNSK